MYTEEYGKSEEQSFREVQGKYNHCTIEQYIETISSNNIAAWWNPFMTHLIHSIPRHINCMAVSSVLKFSQPCIKPCVSTQGVTSHAHLRSEKRGAYAYKRPAVRIFCKSLQIYNPPSWIGSSRL